MIASSLTWKGGSMRRLVCVSTLSAVLVGITSVSPAAAHGGHRSCGEATRAFIVPLAQSGEFGQLVSPLAKQGGVGDEVAANHAALCEPAP